MKLNKQITRARTADTAKQKSQVSAFDNARGEPMRKQGFTIIAVPAVFAVVD